MSDVSHRLKANECTPSGARIKPAEMADVDNLWELGPQTTAFKYPCWMGVLMQLGARRFQNAFESKSIESMSLSFFAKVMNERSDHRFCNSLAPVDNVKLNETGKARNKKSNCKNSFAIM